MQAEALACLEGIQLATEWVNMPLILESDNASVVAELNATNVSRADWSGIILDVKAAMLCLVQVQVHKIKRDSNKIAHALAQLDGGEVNKDLRMDSMRTQYATGALSRWRYLSSGSLRGYGGSLCQPSLSSHLSGLLLLFTSGSSTRYMSATMMSRTNKTTTSLQNEGSTEAICL
uniref:RNase H type-1 domain-containing protein n=2 Tax=Oryza sativa subsp. japonica TaxID=39947 RepID=Q5W6K2_ORYSJ|nr:hypothetical protein [Oryza sativa Japonica Group]ABF97374.1 hypothetical protein LOC_Os03g39190 [Oryza sativa Japonica Group]